MRSASLRHDMKLPFALLFATTATAYSSLGRLPILYYVPPPESNWTIADSGQPDKTLQIGRWNDGVVIPGLTRYPVNNPFS